MTDLLSLEGDNERGWKSARNPLKVLNHLDFLREQERAIAAKEWARLALARHVEFHPTDRCMLACKGCTYQNVHSDVVFPFAELWRLATLRPRSMVIVGGGEPTMYSDGDARLGDVLCKLRELMPMLRLALITNGVIIPPGNWVSSLDWVRVSLDAATPEMYVRLKGENAFDDVVSNILAYLRQNVRYVGVGFLYSQDNIREYVPVAQMVYETIKREMPDKLEHVNIQYRPFIDDRIGADTGYEVRESQRAEVIEQILDWANGSERVRAFLSNQTNIGAIVAGNRHTPVPFGQCHYAKIFKLVRANGEMRPCCIRVEDPALSLGNLLYDSLDKIGRMVAEIANLQVMHCRPATCRWGKTNRLLEDGLQGLTLPSRSADVCNDPMF